MRGLRGDDEALLVQIRPGERFGGEREYKAQKVMLLRTLTDGQSQSPNTYRSTYLVTVLPANGATSCTCPKGIDGRQEAAGLA